MKNDKLIIGVTGSIASGKSTFSNILEKKGFVKISSDEIVHKLYQKGGAAQKAILSLGIEDVLKEGEIDRDRLRKIIFKNPSMKQKIEALVHPLVVDEIKTTVQASSEKNFVVEVPLLFEVGLKEMFSVTVTVFSDRDKVIKRTMDRYSISEIEADSINNSQIPVEEKKKLSDFVVDNNGSLEDLEEEVTKLLVLIKDEKHTDNKEG